VKALRAWMAAAALAVAVVLAIAAGTAAPAAAASTSYGGTLTDGATWKAEVPDDWNGIVILASHGFGPPVLPPSGVLPPPVQTALLDRGYAVAGSSYQPSLPGSWWALKSAVGDQFETIDAFTAAVGEEPDRVLALGTSMGGLVSALEAEQTEGDIDGALTTCGIVAGAVHLNNYQLDAEYVISKLLSPTPIQLVDFLPNIGAGFLSGIALTNAAQQAQTTPEGRARLALALAFLNAPPAASGQPIPDLNDPEAVEAAQFAGYFGAFPVMVFIQAARPWIELSAGGNGSWTLGEDFKSLLDHSPYAPVVRALYKNAGLDLNADLATLTAGADIAADPDAIASLQETSVPTGQLKVPELNLHTLYDHLVPVEQENEYGSIVRNAGKNSLLRQAYVDRIGHCAFTPAEIVAGVEALRHRVETGRWDSVAEAQKLQEAAESLDLGGAAFVRYQPAKLSGDNGPFDPSLNAG
jgi:hypothetical protein